MSVDDLILTDNARLIPFDDRYCITKSGVFYSRAKVGSNKKNHTKRWTERKPTVYGSSKYKGVLIYKKIYSIHQLVLMTFVGPRPKNHVSRHIDGNKSNNCLSNLTYGTIRENANDMVLHGTVLRGKKNPRSKLSKAKVLKIKKMLGLGCRSVKIAKKFNVTPGCIHAIKKKLTWGYL